MPVTRTAVWTPFMNAVWLPFTTAALSLAGRQTVLVGGVHRWGRGTTPVMP